MQEIGLRDKNGVMIHEGDTVRVVFWDRHRGQLTGTVNYDSAQACWKVNQTRICDMNRDKGTTLEVLEAIEHETAKPMKQRRKGKPG